MAPELRTERLRLRHWRSEDRPGFAAMNADPGVMEFFPKTWDEAESNAAMDRIIYQLLTGDFGLWAVEVAEQGPDSVGFVGLSIPSFEAVFTPCVEVGWRLTRDAWGHGYATEAAQACLRYAFGQLQLDEVVSFTAVQNVRSQAVMRRLGMQHDPADDFDHPKLEGHPLQRHVLFRLGNAT